MASVGVFFVSQEDYKLLNSGEVARWNWRMDNANQPKFHGYVDSTDGEFVEIDREQGLYRQSIYAFLGDHVGKQIKDIAVDRMFEACVISDEDYNNEAHLARWKKLFKEADPESYLYLEFH